MTTTLTDRVPVGTRVRCTDGTTATVVDHRDTPVVGRAYDYVIRLDQPDACGERIAFAARDGFEPIAPATLAYPHRVRILTGMAGGRVGTVLSAYPGYHGTVVNVELEIPVRLTDPDGPTHVVQMRYAPDELEATEEGEQAAPVPDVVFAENGATAIAPPPLARRAYSPDSLASLLVGTPPGVAHQVDVEHTVRIAALESILAEARQESQRAQDALVVERAKAEAFAAELAAERDVRLTAERRAAANGAALLAARPVVDAAIELVDQWVNPDSTLRESALSTALTAVIHTYAEATR